VPSITRVQGQTRHQVGMHQQAAMQGTCTQVLLMVRSAKTISTHAQFTGIPTGMG
jgi:hypothetical protein